MPPARKKRAPRIQPVTFIPVERAFKAQIKVRALRDISGWADRKRKIKYHIGHGRLGYLDEDTARVWQAKGYVQILDGTVKPVSADELAELTSKDTNISL